MKEAVASILTTVMRIPLCFLWGAEEAIIRECNGEENALYQKD